MLRIVGFELIKMYCIPHCSKLCISCSNYHSFARITCLLELYFLNSFFKFIICMSRLTNVLLLIFNFTGYECYCIFTNYKTSKLYNWIYVPDVTI